MVQNLHGRRVPYWAFGLLFIALLVNGFYVYKSFQIPVDGIGAIGNGTHSIVNVLDPNSSAEKAGILPGDIIVGVEGKPVASAGYKDLLEQHRPGDKLEYVIERAGETSIVNITLGSHWAQYGWFHFAYYLLILTVCTTSIYILYKKPYDQTAKLFFIFLQLFAIAQNQSFLFINNTYALIASIIFIIGFNLFGVVLLHFHLLFPNPVPFYSKIKGLLKGTYLMGALLGLTFAFMLVWREYTVTETKESVFIEYSRLLLLWIAVTLSLALALAIYQFRRAKGTPARKQLRLVLIGSLFGLLTPIFYSLFADFIWRIQNEMNMIYELEFANGIGTYIMTSFLAIAIFRYRMWNLEIIFRNTLRYGGATIIIFSLYISLLSVVNILLIPATNLVHFIILAICSIIFLLLRDVLQRFIDRLFYRESYDSTTVVEEFEKHFSGIYNYDVLSSRVAFYFTNIFHNSSLLFAIREDGLTYKVTYASGLEDNASGNSIKVSPETNRLLKEAKIFSVEEIRQTPSGYDTLKGEIIVPLMNGSEPFGFLIMGKKITETSYSLQDIRVLTLLSFRIVSLFYTAKLFQRDLSRQVMLEKERTRIARDIHDDIGANLTRISIMSDIVSSKETDPQTMKKWLQQISETCRDVTQEMTQIIWALTPKNDSFEGLITYVRRFTSEYLEPSKIICEYDFPEDLNSMELRAETRRNIFLSLREALHNIVKHSRANKVMISFARSDGWINVTIKDNGQGFNPEIKRSNGNGLNNIRKRMAHIGGKLIIMARPGEGSEVLLSIPLRSLALKEL